MKLNIKSIKIFNDILLLALLCFFIFQLYNTFVRYEEKFENPVKVTKQDYGNDYITQYGKRFVEIKKIFFGKSKLAYFGEAGESFAEGYYHYVLTQYYLSPNLILKNNEVQDTIIYNLYASKKLNPATNFHLNNGWHVVMDLNNGLIILAK